LVTKSVRPIEGAVDACPGCCDFDLISTYYLDSGYRFARPLLDDNGGVYVW